MNGNVLHKCPTSRVFFFKDILLTEVDLGQVKKSAGNLQSAFAVLQSPTTPYKAG